MNDLRTNLIELISSTHCEQRKREREICRHDLQSAKKYGLKTLERSRNGKLRVKFIYNNIVYITEDDEETSVTCYALNQLPITAAVLDHSKQRQINEQRRRICANNTTITSHTILVIDQSTSMNKSDVIGHRSRSRCVFYSIANEMIASVLLQDKMSYTDVCTMIEMRTEATVYNDINMEPFTWELHNKFVHLASLEQALRGRGQGNYIEALDKAYNTLITTDNGTSALNIFLLTDGRPSDKSLKGEVNSTARILNTVRRICRTFMARLTFGVFGFAHNQGSQFDLLHQMASAARGEGSKVVFSVGASTQSLRLALSTVTTSLISTRTACSSLAGGTILRAKTNYGKRERTDMIQDTKDITYANSNNAFFNIADYDVYTVQGPNRLLRYTAHWIRNYTDIEWKSFNLIHPSAAGIAMKKKFMEKGAERAAYDLIEVDEHLSCLGRSMVGKMSLYDEPQIDFLKACARTQLTARRLANKFNSTLTEKHIVVPPITFLEPYYYEWNFENGRIGAVLAEKRLDINRYKKWNDNKGGIDTLQAKPLTIALECIEEEGSDDDDKSTSDLSVNADDNGIRDQIIDDDVPQAFSHWTHKYTKGENLVCDLQGVMSNEFELTDPAIHSSKGLFGRTDHGRKGMRLFFTTHKCNPLCEALRLKMPASDVNRDNKRRKLT